MSKAHAARMAGHQYASSPRMGAAGVQEQGSRVTRLAVVLAGLALSLFAASPAEAARTEYFGIAQGRELDAQDLHGMAAARVRTDRFLLQWRSVQPSQGTFNWTQQLTGSSAALPRTESGRSHSCGGPRSGCARALRVPRSTATSPGTAWQNFLKAAVARYGPGGSYWANGYRQRYGPGATPLPIQSWQIWNEPNLRSTSTRGERPGMGSSSTPSCCRSPTTRSRAGIRKPGSSSPECSAPGTRWPGTSSSGLYKIPGFKNNFDVAALHPYVGLPGRVPQADSAIPRVMKNHGDSATPLWLTEFGWGSANPDRFGINKGLAGQAKSSQTPTRCS